TQPTADGDIAVYQTGIAPPALPIVYYKAAQTRANNGILALGAGDDFVIKSDQLTGSVHVIVDVAGDFKEAPDRTPPGAHPAGHPGESLRPRHPRIPRVNDPRLRFHGGHMSSPRRRTLALCCVAPLFCGFARLAGEVPAKTEVLPADGGDLGRAYLELAAAMK